MTLKTNSEVFEFVSAGLACHAICLAHEMGILEILDEAGSIATEALKGYKNFPLIRAAMNTLAGAGLVNLNGGVYVLSSLGRTIYKDIGSIVMPFSGYGRLLAKQSSLASDPDAWSDSDLDNIVISDASVNFGETNLDPVIFSIIKNLNPRQTICDFGCGSAEKLFKISCKFGVKGLGFDRSLEVVKKAQRTFQHVEQLEIVQGDIRDLSGIWEDVELGLMSFAFHDIHLQGEACQFLTNLPSHFPQMKHLIVADIVSFSEAVPSIMPGFDYVHGLQGIAPRTYEETLEVFEQSGFTIVDEVAVPNMPNTFVWVLEPALSCKDKS